MAASSQPTHPTSFPNSQTTSNNRNLPFVRRLILAIILLFVVITSVSFISWLILHPQAPVVCLDSLSVSNFNLSDLQTNARYKVGFTVTNPNKKISLEFETFTVSVFYKRRQLSRGWIGRPFEVRKMNETGVIIELGSNPKENCRLRGRAAVDVAEMVTDWKQRREMSLNVIMMGLAEFKAGDWLSRHKSIIVFCNNLEVAFDSDDASGMTGKLRSAARTNYCSVDVS